MAWTSLRPPQTSRASQARARTRGSRPTPLDYQKTGRETQDGFGKETPIADAAGQPSPESQGETLGEDASISIGNAAQGHVGDAGIDTGMETEGTRQRVEEMAFWKSKVLNGVSGKQCMISITMRERFRSGLGSLFSGPWRPCIKNLCRMDPSAYHSTGCEGPQRVAVTQFSDLMLSLLCRCSIALLCAGRRCGWVCIKKVMMMAMHPLAL